MRPPRILLRITQGTSVLLGATTAMSGRPGVTPETSALPGAMRETSMLLDATPEMSGPQVDTRGKVAKRRKHHANGALNVAAPLVNFDCLIGSFEPKFVEAVVCDEFETTFA
jgi:hypothetical protein